VIFTSPSISDSAPVQDTRNVEVLTPMERLEALAEKVEAFAHGMENGVAKNESSSSEKDSEATSN
jgi:hypothetical protein